jgi:ankyrin repeat protein
MKNSIRNFLVLSLIVASAPVMAAPTAQTAQQSKKDTEAQAWERQQELNAQLIDAVMANNASLVKQLIARGADVNGDVRVYYEYNRPKDSLLAWKKNSALPTIGRDIKLVVEGVWISPIYAALSSNNAAMFKLLIEHGANKKNALLACIYYKNEAFLKIIMQYIDINKPLDEYQSTALMVAAGCGHVELCKQLINQGANVNAQTSYGSTALRMAICGANYTKSINHFNICKLLLEHRANIDLQDTVGGTALSVALYFGQIEISKLLIEATANVNLDDALMITAKNGHLELCKLLLKHGANANAKDSFGVTALMLAACHGETVYLNNKIMDGLGICKLLLEHGANIDLQDNKDASALHYAVFSGEIEIAKFLIKAGANLNLKDNNGETALDYCETRSPNQEIRQLLIAHGAMNGLKTPATTKKSHTKSRWVRMKTKVRKFIKQI